MLLESVIVKRLHSDTITICLYFPIFKQALNDLDKYFFSYAISIETNLQISK